MTPYQNRWFLTLVTVVLAIAAPLLVTAIMGAQIYTGEHRLSSSFKSDHPNDFWDIDGDNKPDFVLINGQVQALPDRANNDFILLLTMISPLTTGVALAIVAARLSGDAAARAEYLSTLADQSSRRAGLGSP